MFNEKWSLARYNKSTGSCSFWNADAWNLLPLHMARRWDWKITNISPSLVVKRSTVTSLKLPGRPATFTEILVSSVQVSFCAKKG